jgi:hydrogenase large subunit
MSKVVELQIPINRVEGDLDIKVKIQDGIIVDAKSIGTLYRGFENILQGRDPLDALVMTPRVCGICSISHLNAAVKALEDAYGITPPVQAIRLRNLSIICENLQSDLKQVFLMFMADFASDYYKDKSFHSLAKKYYEPFHGELSKDILNATKDVLKIIAYIGGQWPHTSHMVPGGLCVLSDDLEILRIRFLIVKFKEWYENRILDTTIKEFQKIQSLEELENFVQKHPSSHVSLFTQIAKETELFEIGKTGYGFINYGSIDNGDGSCEIPQGYYQDFQFQPLDISQITEDVTYSWFASGDTDMFLAKTKPDMKNEQAYSFTKAPRYNNEVMQTGPLGEELAIENQLFVSLYKKYGDCVYVRELARLLRPLRYIKVMEREIENIIKNLKDPIYEEPVSRQNAQGVGLVHAARGALGHWINIKDGKIANYQIISPTTWNGSPRDRFGNLGAWEKALIGLKIKDIDNPMEMGHVIRSFDPCLVCTVHFIGDKEQTITLRG